MKFYITKYDNADKVKRLAWSGTQLDAKQDRKIISAMDGNTNIESLEFDVPTDKPGLLAFLNTHLSGEFAALR